MRSGPLAALVLLLSTAAFGGQSPPDSGIEGRVLAGPTCPVVRKDDPCPDRPFAATIRIRRLPDGKLVATVRAGRSGRFRVPLAPGRYVLRPLSPRPLVPPRAPPRRVRVLPHAFTKVTILYDSGIR